jgi:hypothetical protein
MKQTIEAGMGLNIKEIADSSSIPVELARLLILLYPKTPLSLKRTAVTSGKMR